jgi:hypothetical protein
VLSHCRKGWNMRLQRFPCRYRATSLSGRIAIAVCRLRQEAVTSQFRISAGAYGARLQATIGLLVLGTMQKLTHRGVISRIR